jgi:hypothetical protein
MAQPKAINGKPAPRGKIPTLTIGTFALAASVANLIVGTLVFVEFSVIVPGSPAWASLGYLPAIQ